MCEPKPGPEVLNLFSCSSLLSMKFNLHMNIKIAQINEILRLKSSKSIIILILLTFISRLNFMLSVVDHEKSSSGALAML